MSRTERLFDLLQLLRSHRYPITAAKLATELEVTVRTVYRDILTLLALGARWVSQRADSRLAHAARNALARIEAVLPTKLREYRGRDN